MAKGYAFADITKPASCTATPAAGGTLAASTTYYYRVIGVKSTVVSVSYYWNGKSPASDEFSGTTDTTNKSMTISFTMPSGEGVYAYRIFRSTTSNGYIPVAESDNDKASVVRYYPKDSDFRSGTTITFTDTGYVAGSENCYLEITNDSHGVLTLSGSADGDRFSIVDLYNADVANGWGVITKLSHNAYKVNCYLVASSQYWRDYEKTIILCDGMAAPQFAQFGYISGEITYSGCKVYNTATWLDSWTFSTLNAYRTSFVMTAPWRRGTITSYYLGGISFSAGTIQDSDCDGFRNFTPSSATNCIFKNFTMSRFDNAFGAGAATFTNVRMLSGIRVWQTGGYTTIYGKGVYTEGCQVVLWINTNNTVTLVDTQFTGAGICSNIATGSVLYDKISYNLNVVDDVGTAISGAAVKIYDKDGTLVVDTTTAASGSITEQEITRRQYTVTGTTVSAANNRYPFRVVVSKTGYQSYDEDVSYLTSVAVIKTVALAPLGTQNATTIHDSTIYSSTIY